MSYLPQDIPTSELGVGIGGVGVRGWGVGIGGVGVRGWGVGIGGWELGSEG